MKRFPHGEETTLDFEWWHYDIRLWVANDYQQRPVIDILAAADRVLLTIPYCTSKEDTMLALSKLEGINAVQVRGQHASGAKVGCMCYTVPFNESE